jgi:hypothetical protein
MWWNAMPEMPIPIIKGDKTEDADYIDAVPVNMYAVAKDILGSKGYLISHDGLEQIRTGQGKDRGALYNDRMGRSFRISGQKLIEILPAGTTIIVDISGTDQVSIAYSFNSMMIVANGRAWRYNGTTLTEITDLDLGNPIDVCWIDNYYFFTDGEYLYHTDIDDETSIDPLKFATSEISPDPTKAVGRTQDNLVIVFNRYSTEYFINQANPFFAFSRLNQKAVSAGIVGTHCWCEMGGNIFMLGGRKEERPSIHVLGAGQTTAIATRSIDKILSQYSEADLSYSILQPRISERDSLLYVHLPNHVLLFNQGIAEKFGVDYAWAVLKSGQDKWRAINGVFDPKLNQWVYGDKIDSRIGALTNSAGQYDEAQHAEFYTPLISGLESASIDSLEINTVGGYGDNPVNLFVATTRDGASYSMEWSKEATAPLYYSKRYIINRLGYVRHNIGFKFRCFSKDTLNVCGLKIIYG